MEEHKENQNSTFSFETRKEALTIDPYSITVQIFPHDHVAPITVGHIPMELSRFIYFFKKRGGVSHAHIQTTKYRPSPIPEGGLEIPLMVTFKYENEDKLSKMKTFADENYDDIVEEITVDDSDKDECKIVLD